VSGNENIHHSLVIYNNALLLLSIGKKKKVQHDLIFTAGIKRTAMSSILPLTLFSLMQLGSGFDSGTLLST
jgi:hypothetical protein